MNRRQIALKLVLHELGISQSMDLFDDRLILQKAVYLVQQADIPLGYQYSWYLRGPYSRDLTSDAFATLHTSTPEDWSLGEKLKRKIEKVKKFIDHIKSNPDAVREFEKLASVLFVIKTGQAAKNDFAKIEQRMKTAKKDFTLEEIKHAVQILRGQQLI